MTGWLGKYTFPHFHYPLVNSHNSRTWVFFFLTIELNGPFYIEIYVLYILYYIDVHKFTGGYPTHCWFQSLLAQHGENTHRWAGFPTTCGTLLRRCWSSIWISAGNEVLTLCLWNKMRGLLSKKMGNLTNTNGDIYIYYNIHNHT